jgi:hypothetical protein
LHPQIVLEDDDGKPLDVYYLPERAHIEVGEGPRSVRERYWPRRPAKHPGFPDITGRSASSHGDLRGATSRRTRRSLPRSMVRSRSWAKNAAASERLSSRARAGIEREHLVPHGKRFLVHPATSSRLDKHWSMAPWFPTTSCVCRARKPSSSTWSTRSSRSTAANASISTTNTSRSSLRGCCGSCESRMPEIRICCPD